MAWLQRCPGEIALVVFGLWVGAHAVAACSTDQPPPQTQPSRPDPNVRALDRLLQRGSHEDKKRPAEEVGPRPDTDSADQCLLRAQQSDAARQCAVPADAQRTFGLRLALDPCYSQSYADWQQRMVRTLTCVNTLYNGTGIQWRLAQAHQWDPGPHRQNLHLVLRRLHRDFPPDMRHLTLGVVVWDKKNAFARGPRAVGLSQGTACVVPSWPQEENDCMILAHELGHLVGARHVPGRQWIMSWAGSMYRLPSANAMARVLRSAGFHPRNVEAFRAHVLAKFSAQGLLIPRSCREKLAQLDRCWRLR